jgi:hypothetical protein
MNWIGADTRLGMVLVPLIGGIGESLGMVSGSEIVNMLEL